MKISQILKEERAEGRNKNVARLYLENGWYRAYEWSAYLVHNYPNTLADDNKLKPTHKFVKECNESVISVGLKLKMMDKFMPNATPQMNEGYMDVAVDLPPFAEDEKEEELLSKWKESVLVQKPKESAGRVYSQPLSMTAIIKDIMTYRLENTTAEDDREFLYALKEKCYSLI